MSDHLAHTQSPIFDSSVDPAERYEIVGRIASGGMAEIYLAKMLTTAGVEREVVLKRLLPELQQDHEFVQMFHDEAQIASQLNHPNVVQIFELGELDESLFISMELLRGVNLRDLLARLHHDNQKIPTEIACRIFCGALEGLGYAHNFSDQNNRPLNIIHRDVSPQNIIVTYEGTVKVVDFGVAKAEGKLHQTRAGLVKGKFAYMSPEQVQGHGLDGRSDIFALSEIFYELLLHRHPFFAESDMDVLRLILEGRPPHPNALDQSFSPELADIILKAMKREPDDRYDNAQDFLLAIEQFLVNSRKPATTMSVGRFVRELFSDRMALEQKARKRNDEELLVKAMTVGRAERWEMTGTARPTPESEEEPGFADKNFEDNESTLLGVDTSVDEEDYTEETEITQAAVENPLQGLDPRIQSVSEGSNSMGNAKVEVNEDPAEAPTMMGMFTEEELEQLREAPLLQPQIDQVDATSENLSVKVEPASKNQTGPVISRSSRQPSDPAVQRPSKHNLNIGRKVAAEESRPQVKKQAPASIAATTPLAKTHPQRQDEAERSRQKRSKDQLGMWLFALGLGALIGALVYAGILIFTSTSTIHLVIRSEPSGAQIWLDGYNTGFTTPHEIPNVASDKAHRLELKHQGHKTYVRKIESAPENNGEPYVINKVLEPITDSSGENPDRKEAAAGANDGD